jgi:3-oxoacyl-[acyl-carrier-protein] synthase III
MSLPERVETSASLAGRLGRSEEWIVSRTGVTERRVSDVSMAELAARAVRGLGLGDERPDLLINASLTPIQLIPDSSVFVLRALGWDGLPSFSVHHTCLSFLTATQVAAGLIGGGAHRRIVIVSAEQGSVCRDFDEPESAALIGDGAAAALIERATGNEGFLGYATGTWPEGSDFAELRGCGTGQHPNDPTTLPAHNLFHMRGPRLWRLALEHADEILDRAFGQAGMARGDVDLVIPHQASGPMVDLFPKFGFADDRVVKIVATTGNCIAASLPMALAHAEATGRLQRGMRVLMFGTGAGLSMTAAVLAF